MPRPLKRRRKPDPNVVTIRRVGSDEPIEVVAPYELEARKLAAEWDEFERRRREQERLALRLGECIRVPLYTQEMWWFVVDVDGIERRVTAKTIMFDCLREQSFPFDVVEPAFPYWIIAEQNEAHVAWLEIRKRSGGQATAQRHDRAA